MNHLIQSLESRRMMSTTLPVPPPMLGDIISEPVNEFAGISQTVRIGYIPRLIVGHISQLQGSISWGDGTSSAAEFDRNKNGGIDIIAAHVYVKPGIFSISTNFITETPWEKPGQPAPEYVLLLGQVKTTATVAPTPAQLTETAGKPFTAVLGKFNQFTLDVTFTAVINWGDGITSAGILTGGDLAQGNWVVSGTHTYAHAGSYLVNAKVYSHVVGFKGPGSLSQDFLTLIHVTK